MLDLRLPNQSNMVPIVITDRSIAIREDLDREYRVFCEKQNAMCTRPLTVFSLYVGIEQL